MAKKLNLSKKKAVDFPAAGQLSQLATASKQTKKPRVSAVGIQNATGEKPAPKRAPFKMNTRLGQHLLKNPGIIEKIVKSAEVGRSDTVLEIGPGTGNLTIQLCALAKKVIGLEIDQRMAAEVRKRCSAGGFSNVEIKHGDALKSQLDKFDVCVANLPYQISSPFLFRLLKHKFRCAVLMFQKEFGERLVSLPGDKNYCRLSVNTQLFCTVTRVCHVAAASFNPPPKVDSIVVKLVPKKHIQSVDYDQWDAMLRLIFSRKRRTLQASFRSTKTAKALLKTYQLLHISDRSVASLEVHDFKGKLQTVLDGLDYAKTRAVELGIEELERLQAAMHQAGIYFATSKCSDIPMAMFDDEGEEDDDDDGMSEMGD